jgi:NAD(P)-dependent dehydrogenase (short-subunit alcohol dehydrogenase family)
MVESRSVVITGGSSGIGAALVTALAADGYQVFTCARRSERLREVTDNGRLATGFVCDISKEADVIAFAREIASKTDRVYALVNCAAIFGAIGPALDSTVEDWTRAIQVNLIGMFSMTRHVVPLMRPQDQPRIVNFTGGGAFSCLPRLSSYGVSKAGIVRLTETLAIDLAEKNILVNAVAPGFVATEIHQAVLAAGPKVVGEEYFELVRTKLNSGTPMSVPIGVVRFLLSPSAGRLTGKTIAASFDRWSTPDFAARIEAINASPLYTMQRINLVHLPDDDPLRAALDPPMAAPKI